MGEWNDNLFSSKNITDMLQILNLSQDLITNYKWKFVKKTIVRCFLPEWLLLKNKKKVAKNYFSILAWVSFRYLLSLSEFEWS